MRSHTRLMRMGVWLATTSLSLTTALSALAQPAAPPGQAQPGADLAGDQGSDPPALAGRVAAITGSVSFHTSSETQWSAATLNYPVTNGEAFWTEPQAQATLEIADDRMVLAASTELDVSELDVNQFTTTAAQGAVFLQLSSLPQGQNVTINTPRGAVTITAVGRYEIVAGDTNDATTVSVVEGAAHVAATDLSLDIGPQQTATIGGTDTLQGSVGPLQEDAFLHGLLSAPAHRAFAAGVPRQVQYMTGADDLQTYGSFTQSAQYGQVWYPRDVASTWAPYRDGHWSYVQPWGWTWVDNARWGFAPFHYGRWVQVENRWGWVAGGEEQAVAEASPYPVYSPALVSFVDVGVAGVGVGLGVGFGGGGGYAPAWIPLGPREPYYPWYHCQPSYFSRLNTPYGVPRTIIERGPTYINNERDVNITRNVFINQRAATVIPAAAFARGQPVGSFGRPLPVADLARARPLVGRLAVAPTQQTPNLPPAAARRYNVALPATPVQRVAAGPRIEAAGAQPRAVPQLRRAAPPPGVRVVPAAQVRNGPAQGANPALANPRQNAPGAGRDLRSGAARGQLPGAARDQRPGAARDQGAAGAPRVGGPEAGRPLTGPGAARTPAGLPALRGPGTARPDARAARPDLQPAGEPRGAARQPGAAAPAGGVPPAGTRPGGGLSPSGRPVIGAPRAAEPGRPAEATRPAAGARPETAPQLRQPAQAPGTRPVEAPRPGASARPELRTPGTPAERSTPEPAARRTEPARTAPEAAPRQAAPAPRPAAPRPEPRPVPRVEAPRPAPRPEAPRPAPRAEAPRVEAPRPAPRPEAPRPAPRVEAPRPAPRAEPARPAPRPEPPRPAPAAPRPEPRPAPPAHPAPGKKEPPKG